MPVSITPALESFLDILLCPVCGASFNEKGGALRCPACHTFDMSRHGYVSLLTGTRATSGDDGPMIQARDRFLASGKYEPIRRTVADLASSAGSGRSTVVDVGCGTGYYLAGVLQRLPRARGLGLDTAAHAVRSTARVHERGAAATWDVFRPFPLADEVVDVVLDVFAPRNPIEFHRVMRPDGRLVVVRPTEQHLCELRGRLPGIIAVDPAKECRLHRVLAPFFEVVRTERVEYAMTLTMSEAADLLGMTPSARHRSGPEPGDRASLDEITVSVLASAYRPR